MLRLSRSRIPGISKLFFFPRFNSTESGAPAVISTFETLKVEIVAPHVTHVELNRPKSFNAMNDTFMSDLQNCFEQLDKDKTCRAVVLSGAGKVFCAGLDLKEMSTFQSIISSDLDIARKCSTMYEKIRSYQHPITAIEKCRKPVITAIHSGCIGGGVDLISTADIRYCTSDSWFQIKEVDIGMAADIGTLQRFPKIVGNDSLVRELCYTARKLFADEALKMGLVSRIFPDKKSMIESAIELGTQIAAKSPVAIQGTKVILNYSRDHSVDESLEYEAVWNMSMLQSEDLVKSIMAGMEKKVAMFSDY